MKLKPIILALAISPLALSTFATPTPVAATLSVDGGTATKMESFDNISTKGFASDSNNKKNSYDVGATLTLLGTSDVTFEFIGKEASYLNVLTFNGQNVFTNMVKKGTSQTFYGVSAGLLNFGFISNSAGPTFTNGNDPKIAFMTNKTDTQALALFNDGYPDKDFDDMGVKITVRAAVAAVPEPETYALLLAGLGLIGTMVRRRKVMTQG